MKHIEPKVVIVDDDLSLCRALTRLLQVAEFSVTTYSCAHDFLEKHDLNTPGCLVLDVAMPGLSGLELQDALATKECAPPIIFLTGNATVPGSVRALKHGAVDFLTKPVDESVLLDAIRSAIDKDHAERAKREEHGKIAQLLATLTPRESQVLSHVVAGKLNKQIAVELGTVEKTIKVHRARVMEKMRVHSLAELVVVAIQAGITTSSSN